MKKATKLNDWRAALLSRVRTLVEEADPEVIEEAKWKKANRPEGVPTWSHDGIICTGETYKDKVKLTFAQGAKLAEPLSPLQCRSRWRHAPRHRFSRRRQCR